ncbi:MAG: hypothetical protein R3B06_31010 [Kofleriaceae bacterium]
MFTVALSPAEQLIVRGAAPVDAVPLLAALRTLYADRRGVVAAGPGIVPRVRHDDAIDLVNAYDRLAAPLAGRLAIEAPALWAAWRDAYARVFDRVLHATNLRAPLAGAASLWNSLLAPFSTHLAAFAASTTPTKEPHVRVS